jgi:hypothetical protein
MQDRSAYDLPGYQDRAGSLAEFANSRGGGQFQAQQGELANMLMAQARGENSFAKAQLGQDLGRLQAQQQSYAAGARPSQSAMASRLASQNMGNLGAQMAGQSQLAQIAERNAAAMSAGNVLGQGRQQDIGAYLGAQNLGIQNALGQQQGTFQYGQSQDNRFGAAMGQPTQGERMFGLLKGIGESFISDQRAKQNVRPIYSDKDAKQDVRQVAPRGMPTTADPRVREHYGPELGDMPRSRASGFSKDVGAGRFEERFYPQAGGGRFDQVERFLGTAAKPYEYEYKPGLGLPPGRRVGPMAQNIAAVAPDAVSRDSGGLMRVDYNKVAPAIMASQGYLNRKLEALKSYLAQNRTVAHGR